MSLPCKMSKMEWKTLPSGSEVRMTIISFIRFPPWTNGSDLMHKENGGLDFSKPPSGYCIMSGRMDDQPPKQRFFYYPFFAACVWMVYTKGKAISAAKQSHRYQFSAECRSILLGYIQTFSYCCFQSPHCLLPGLSHQYPKSGREYQRDQSSSCR